MKKALRKWVVTPATVALLAAAGYFVGDWDPDKGYPVIFDTKDTVTVTDLNGYSSHTVIIDKQDTTYFEDSTELANFAKWGASEFGKTVWAK